MNYKQYIGVLLVGLSIVFGTFFNDWVQLRLGSMFNDYSFFLSFAGDHVVEWFVLLPLFWVMLFSNKSSLDLKLLVAFFTVRMVVAVVLVLIYTPAGIPAIMSGFYTVLVYILLFVSVLRLFNDMKFPFVSRALILLWAMLQVTLFSVPGELMPLVSQGMYLSFLIGMLVLCNYLYVLPPTKRT